MSGEAEAVLAAHEDVSMDMTTPREFTEYGGWCRTCQCGRPLPDTGADDEVFYTEHRAHVATALAPLIAERERLAAERALRERGIDPAPETVGEPYRHEERGGRGRVCLARADGSGWWPLRWEDGKPNLSGGTFCLLPHPEGADQ